MQEIYNPENASIERIILTIFILFFCHTPRVRLRFAKHIQVFKGIFFETDLTDVN